MYVPGLLAPVQRLRSILVLISHPFFVVGQSEIMELRVTVLLQHQDEFLFCFTIKVQCQLCSFACAGFLCMGVLPNPMSFGSGQPDSSGLGGYLMLICVHCFRCSP